MHLIIDGYNLLYAGRSPIGITSTDLQRERDRLIHQLSRYRQMKPCEVTVVFDGWQGGWGSEKRERVKGMELIFSKLGEKADEVIKRLVREKGSAAVVVTSDRDIAKYAERRAAAVVPSYQFRERLELSTDLRPKSEKGNEEEASASEGKRKGPARRLSKKERRRQSALKKL
jgi:uncharacterized protein